MDRRLRSALIFILTVALLTGLAMATLHYKNYRDGAESYRSAAETAGLERLPKYEPPEPTPRWTYDGEDPSLTEPGEGEIILPGNKADASLADDEWAACLLEMDLDALREVNSEIIGWIIVPGTEINYPLLQTGSNETYLHTTWDGTWSSVGSIFMEKTCSADPEENYNTILYGHRMRDGSMFAGLKDYWNADFRDAHPYVYLRTGDTVRRYEIFSAYQAKLNDVCYYLDYPTEAIRAKLPSYGVSRSYFDCGLRPTTEDSYLTLSTCTGNGHSRRWVVLAFQTGLRQK